MARSNGNTWKLALGSVGVVYGDIGTSPLYAMREGLRAAADEGLTEREVIGITSLLLWTIIVIVTFKYVILILRAETTAKAAPCRCWLWRRARSAGAPLGFWRSGSSAPRCSSAT
jgi:K+ transporter